MSDRFDEIARQRLAAVLTTDVLDTLLSRTVEIHEFGAGPEWIFKPGLVDDLIEAVLPLLLADAERLAACEDALTEAKEELGMTEIAYADAKVQVAAKDAEIARLTDELGRRSLDFAAWTTFIKGGDIPQTIEAARAVLLDRCLNAEAERDALLKENNILMKPLVYNLRQQMADTDSERTRRNRSRVDTQSHPRQARRADQGDDMSEPDDFDRVADTLFADWYAPGGKLRGTVAAAFRAHYAPDVLAAKIEAALTPDVYERAYAARMDAPDDEAEELAAWRAVLMQAISAAMA